MWTVPPGSMPITFAVVCEVVDRAHRDPVDDRRRTARIAVLEDVGGLEEGRLPQGTDRTPPAVGPEHDRPELMLVEPDERLARRISPKVRTVDRHERPGAQLARVADEDRRFELDDAPDRIVAHDEHRGDDRILAGRHAAEVDQGHSEFGSRPERPIVGLGVLQCPRAGGSRRPVVIDEAVPRLIAPVVVRCGPGRLRRTRHET